MIDIGLNLSSSQFNSDRTEIIQEALNSGVKGFLLTGTDVTNTELVMEYSNSYPNIFKFTSGIHPNHLNNFKFDMMNQISEYSNNSNCVAIGETGLDYHRCTTVEGKKLQKLVFRNHLELAKKKNLPLFLHIRPSYNNQNEILTDFKEIYSEFNLPGVVHCFTGNRELLDFSLELGLYIGMTGYITEEKRGKHLRELITSIPLDKLMIETDAPYLTPKNINLPRRNVPKNLVHINEYISKFYNIEPSELASITNDNFEKLFKVKF